MGEDSSSVPVLLSDIHKVGKQENRRHGACLVCSKTHAGSAEWMLSIGCSSHRWCEILDCRGRSDSHAMVKHGHHSTITADG
jgi:hypothetical protein